MDRRIIGLAILLSLAASALAQEGLSEPRAATVNGEAIPELAVQRAIKPIPAEHQAKARQEILNFLIDMTLVDQYLLKQNIPAPKEEVSARVERIKQETKKANRDYDELLKQLSMTEEELRQQLAADLRWENYVKAQAPDKLLADFFASNKEWFDGSQVRARHLLVAVPAEADAQTRANAQAKLKGIMKQIETKLADEVAKLDPKLEPLAKEQARQQKLVELFAEAAKDSDCPSKKNGGDLGWFPRVGSMVEPFAKAAFTLQPSQMTGPVETQFGYHAILVTGRMPGKEVKFDDMKEDVREIYAEKLRDDLVPQLRKTAKIEIVEPKKQ